MKYIFSLLSFTFILCLLSCERPDEKPPTVSILTPENNSIVYAIVKISCLSFDSDAVENIMNGNKSKDNIWWVNTE